MHSLSALKWHVNLDNMPALSKRKKIMSEGRENDVKCSLTTLRMQCVCTPQN